MRPKENPSTLENDCTDPVLVAEEAGLRYVNDSMPGIGRERDGDGWVYIGVGGQPLTRQFELDRFAALAIPPAWTDVWISPKSNGHIQATGRDAKGRKQYRYHPHWREVRDETKYHRMIAFGEALPAIRERARHDLSLTGLPVDRVLATVVELLDETAIRVGNEEYARANQSYGLTTLERRHVDMSTTTLHFHFRGKSGKEHQVDIRDRRLVRVVKRMEELPGHEVFQYIDENGERCSVDSADVNRYLQETAEGEYTAKDFRTWHGTVRAAQALQEVGPATSDRDSKHRINLAIKAAADLLGNTVTICRKSYVNPDVIDGYLDGSLAAAFARHAGDEIPDGLHHEEAVVLGFLRDREAARETQVA